MVPPDVDDHVAAGLLHREPHPDGGGDGFGHQHHLAGAGSLGRVPHGTFLDFGDSRGNSDDDPGPDKELAPLDPLDELADHVLGLLEIADDAVLEGADGEDFLGRTAEHGLGVLADGEHLAKRAVHRDHRGLVEDNALSPHIDEGVGRPQINGHVGGEDSHDLIEHVSRCPFANVHVRA